MDHIKYWQEHGKTELSHTAGGNVKSYNNFLSSLLPRFFKFYVPCDSVILLFGIWSRELLPCKYLCANFHRNFTCNSQRLEAVHMPSHPWMDKTNCGIHEMLFSQKEHTFDKLQIYLLVNLALIFFGKKEIMCENALLYIVRIQHWGSPRRDPLATTVKAFAVTFDWGGKTHSECRQHNPKAWVLDWTKRGKGHNISISSSQFPDRGYNVLVFSISIACLPYHDGFCLQTVSQK